MNRLLHALTGLLFCTSAASAQVLYGPSAIHGGTIDGVTITNSKITDQSLTGANASGANVTPSGATTAATLAALAAQQGVLLDTFRVAGDADDTASMTRAVAAFASSGCILLGPHTYQVSNYSMAGTPANFCLKGVKGQSIIQRQSASGSQFFQLSSASVYIDGVIFDMNKAGVTANQWGVFLGAGGQSVNVTNSVFKNNSGSIGTCFSLVNTTGTQLGGSFRFTDNEVTGCNYNPVFLASVANGEVQGNYIHDNTGYGIFAGSYLTATTTNYATNITIINNRVYRNGQGIQIGGYGLPYVYGVPPAINIKVDHNDLQDNGGYDIILQGDYVTAIGNHISQSPTSPVTHTGAIDCNTLHSVVSLNVVNTPNVSFGIDCGSSQYMTVEGNQITVGAAIGLNASANVLGNYSGNVITINGAGTAIDVDGVDSDGALNAILSVASGTNIVDNVINLTASNQVGITIPNNSGGTPGAIRHTIRRNHFNISGSGTSSSQAISWFGNASSVDIGDNTYNGVSVQFSDPNGSGDVTFDPVFLGGTVYGISSTTNIRSIVTGQQGSLGGQGSILWVYPSSTGSGYALATTTLSATTCTGFSATPMINQSNIIGVRVNNHGTGCSSPVVTATDTGGGTGAVFVVGTQPLLPSYAKLTYVSAATHLLQRSGGFYGLSVPAPFVLSSQTVLNLQAINGGSSWSVVAFTMPQIATSALPTCNATAAGAKAYVNDALSPTYLGALTGGGAVLAEVECNLAGTGWFTH